MVRRRLKSFIVDYIDDIKHLSLSEMVALSTQKQAALAKEVRDLQSIGVNSLEFQEMLRFYKDIRALRYFLETQQKPEHVHPSSFLRLRWIAERLVMRGEFDQKVLELFPDD